MDSWDLSWMKKAFEIGKISGRFPRMFEDEMEITCNKYRKHLEEWTKKELQKDIAFPGWFVRSDKVSLKYGEFGAGPYKTIEEIVQAIVSTISGHECYNIEDTSCTIYLMNWLNLDPMKEFRIFIYQNQITCISDQNIYRINHKLADMHKKGEITNIVHKISQYFEEHVKDKMSYIGSYVMDLGFVNGEMPYFIEPNSFGAQYSSGSALFQWLNDHETIHDPSFIEFRYCSK